MGGIWNSLEEEDAFTRRLHVLAGLSKREKRKMWEQIENNERQRNFRHRVINRLIDKERADEEERRRQEEE